MQTIKSGQLSAPVVFGMLSEALGLDHLHADESRKKLRVALSDAVRADEIPVYSRALGLRIDASKADIDDTDATVSVYDVLRWFGARSQSPIASLKFPGLDVVYSLADRPTEPVPGEVAAEPAIEPDEPPSADRGLRVKRKALIERNSRRWPSIERDLKDASENGLSKAAKADDTYGHWWEGDALKWADARNKLAAPATPLSLSSVVHRMAG